jgi:hypothetical protein
LNNLQKIQKSYNGGIPRPSRNKAAKLSTQEVPPNLANEGSYQSISQLLKQSRNEVASLTGLAPTQGRNSGHMLKGVKSVKSMGARNNSRMHRGAFDPYTS